MIPNLRDYLSKGSSSNLYSFVQAEALIPSSNKNSGQVLNSVDRNFGNKTPLSPLKIKKLDDENPSIRLKYDTDIAESPLPNKQSSLL